MTQAIETCSAPTAEKDRDSRINFRLGVANGALGRLGNAFLSPNFVLAAFIYDVTRSNLLVGLMASLATAGVMWPQLYISSLIEHRPRRKPFYVLATFLRLGTILLVVGSISLAATDFRTLAPWFLLVSYFVFRSCQGCGNLPFFDMVGRTIPPTRVGSFFAQRAFFGDILSLTAGALLVQPILRMVAMPYNYVTLAVIGAVVSGTGWTVFCFAREDADKRPPKPSTLGKTIKRSAKRLSSDRNYRLLLLMRLTLRFVALGVAFSVPFARERVGTAEISGVFVSSIALSRILSSLVWGRISDTRGNRLCFVLAHSLFVVAPILAIVSPMLPEAFVWTAPRDILELNLPTTVFLLSVGLMGFGLQGNMTAYNAFSIETAPPGRLPSYVAFLNTASFPFTFVPVLAGALVGDESWRLNILFVFVALSGMALLVFALMLKEVRGGAGVEAPEATIGAPG